MVRQEPVLPALPPESTRIISRGGNLEMTVLVNVNSNPWYQTDTTSLIVDTDLGKSTSWNVVLSIKTISFLGHMKLLTQILTGRLFYLFVLWFVYLFFNVQISHCNRHFLSNELTGFSGVRFYLHFFFFPLKGWNILTASMSGKLYILVFHLWHFPEDFKFLLYFNAKPKYVSGK